MYDHPGGRLIGVDDIVARTRTALTPLDASQHLIGTILVDVDPGGERATASSYFQAQHVRHGTEGGELLAIAGTYRDELARIAGRWQITHRTQSYSWRHGNPAVTRPPPRRGPEVPSQRRSPGVGDVLDWVAVNAEQHPEQAFLALYDRSVDDVHRYASRALLAVTAPGPRSWCRRPTWACSGACMPATISSCRPAT